MIKQKFKPFLIIGLVIIGVSLFGIMSIFWPVIIGERENLEPYNLYVLFPIIGFICGPLIIFVGIYRSIETDLAKGIYLTVIGGITIGLELVGIILIIIVNLGSPLFVYNVMTIISPSLIPFILVIVMFIYGITLIHKNRALRVIDNKISHN